MAAEGRHLPKEEEGTEGRRGEKDQEKKGKRKKGNDQRRARGPPGEQRGSGQRKGATRRRSSFLLQGSMQNGL